MIRKGESAGLSLSVIGHVGLLALLSLNLMSVRPLPKLSEPMDVMLVDNAGPISTAPQMAQEPPAASEAPEIAPTPEPAPPEPAPTAKATPVPPKPVVSQKAAERLAPPTPPAPKAKPKATTLSNDFLKGIPVDKSVGKGEAPRVAAISPIAANGIIQMIQRKVKPCYKVPIASPDAATIVSRIRLRLKKDGSFAAEPKVEGNPRGVTGTNSRYVQLMNDAATNALRQCAPYKDLPPEYYEGGWEDLAFNFLPAAMN